MWFRRIFQWCDDFGNLYADPELVIRVCAGYRKVSVAKGREVASGATRESDHWFLHSEQ